MWKKLNSILHDKHDYHLDPTLKNEVEISDELLQEQNILDIFHILYINFSQIAQ